MRRPDSDFEERATTTPVGGDCYTTVGRLVPVEAVMCEVPGAKKLQL
jgi:hypothetical protein